MVFYTCFSMWIQTRDMHYVVLLSLASFSTELLVAPAFFPHDTGFLKRPGQLTCKMYHILHLSDCLLLNSFRETFWAKALCRWDWVSLSHHTTRCIMCYWLWSVRRCSPVPPFPPLKLVNPLCSHSLRPGESTVPPTVLVYIAWIDNCITGCKMISF